LELKIKVDFLGEAEKINLPKKGTGVVTPIRCAVIPFLMERTEQNSAKFNGTITP